MSLGGKDRQAQKSHEGEKYLHCEPQPFKYTLLKQGRRLRGGVGGVVDPFVQRNHEHDNFQARTGWKARCAFDFFQSHQNRQNLL